MATIAEQIKAKSVATQPVTQPKTQPKTLSSNSSAESVEKLRNFGTTTTTTTTKPKTAVGQLTGSNIDRGMVSNVASTGGQTTNKAQTTPQPAPTTQQTQTDAYNATVQQAESLMSSLFVEHGELQQITQAEQALADMTTSFTQQMQEFLNKQYEATNLDIEKLFNQTVNTELITQLEQDAIGVKEQIENINSQIRATEDDVRAELGSRATEGQIQRKVASRVKELNRGKDVLLDEYNAVYATFQSEQENAQQLFNIRLQQQQFELQRKDQLTQQTLGLSLQAFEQQMNLATRGLDRAEKEYWNNKQFEDQVELMKLQEDSQKEAMKREYERKKETGQLDKDNIKWITLDDGRTIAVNTDTYETEAEFGAKYDNSLSPEYNGTALDETFNEAIGKYLQCGTFVNNYLQKIGGKRSFGDSYEQKKSLINSKTPKVGSVAILPSKSQPSYGHVGIVTQVNENGTVTIADANWSGDGKVGERTVNISSIDGYYVPSVKQKYNEDLGPIYMNFAYGKTPTQSQVDELGGLDVFSEQSMNYYVEKTSEKFARLGFSFENPALLIASDPETRKTIENDLLELDKNARILDEVIIDIQANGLPLQGVTGGRGRLLKGKMRQLQIFAKGDKQFNLGVLNGPDLTILEDVLPTPTQISAKTTNKEVVLQQLYNAKDKMVDSYTNALSAQGIEYQGTNINTSNDIYSQFANDAMAGMNTFLNTNLSTGYANQ